MSRIFYFKDKKQQNLFKVKNKPFYILKPKVKDVNKVYKIGKLSKNRMILNKKQLHMLMDDICFKYQEMIKSLQFTFPVEMKTKTNLIDLFDNIKQRFCICDEKNIYYDINTFKQQINNCYIN